MKIVSIQLDNSDEAIYIKLAAALESMLSNGELKSGEMLPPVRKLAKDLQMSISTVVAAYRRLEEKGLVYTRRGSGTYCLPRENDKSRKLGDIAINISGSHTDQADGNIINLAGSTPGPEVFPVAHFKEALNHILDAEGGKVFSYQESEGFYGLRKSISGFADRYLHIDCSPDNVIVTAGAQQAIDLITKAMLSTNDIVLAENPTYPGASSIFASRGARILGIPLEKDGINMEVLRYNIKRYRPSLVYTMPVYQTPTGICMSAGKRSELLELAESYNFFILEEDTFGELVLEGGRLLPLKAEDTVERVIYIKSFSKIIMPGIRTGFIIAPRSIADAVARAKYMTDISASGLVQRALGHYLDSGAWDGHIRELLILYRNRLDIALKGLKHWNELGVVVYKPSGGLGIWVRLPEEVKDVELQQKCLERNVMLTAGSSFFVSPMQDYESFIRISYAASDCGAIERGLSVTVDCLRNILNKKSKKVIYI